MNLSSSKRDFIDRFYIYSIFHLSGMSVPPGTLVLGKQNYITSCIVGKLHSYVEVKESQ